MHRSQVTTDVELHGAAAITATGVSRAPLPVRAARIGDAPAARARRFELRDHLVFPGLINAHDHLHLNAVPPLRAGAPFPDSYAWIEAFQAHFERPEVAAALRVPTTTRIFRLRCCAISAGATRSAAPNAGRRCARFSLRHRRTGRGGSTLPKG